MIHTYIWMAWATNSVNYLFLAKTDTIYYIYMEEWKLMSTIFVHVYGQNLPKTTFGYGLGPACRAAEHPPPLNDMPYRYIQCGTARSCEITAFPPKESIFVAWKYCRPLSLLVMVCGRGCQIARLSSRQSSGKLLTAWSATGERLLNFFFHRSSAAGRNIATGRESVRREINVHFIVGAYININIYFEV